MIDTNKILDCCSKCDQECKLKQWRFDSIFKMSGCILADVEMNKIMELEKSGATESEDTDEG